MYIFFKFYFPKQYKLEHICIYFFESEIGTIEFKITHQSVGGVGVVIKNIFISMGFAAVTN